MPFGRLIGIRELSQCLSSESSVSQKRGYKHYYEQCLRLIKPGGMILVDNLLWYGRVVDSANSHKATVALREFNDFLAEDDRISFVIVPIGDGMSLCIKN